MKNWSNAKMVSYQKRFTLVELLVVIGILVSMLMPSLAKAREKARRAVCLSNMKQTLAGLTIYADGNNDEMPPGHAFLNYGIGIGSVYNTPTGRYFAHGYLLEHNIIEDHSLFYCPSWNHPTIGIGKLQSNGKKGGFPLPGGTMPTQNVQTHLAYRSTFDGEARPPHLGLDDSSTALLADLFIKNNGKYFHVQEGFNTTYMDGHGKFIYDKSKTVANMAILGHQFSQQEIVWSTYCDE